MFSSTLKLQYVNKFVAANAASALLTSRRTFLNQFSGNFERWEIPYHAKKTKVTREELQQLKYFPNRHREKWEYHRIDDKINAESEFRKTEGREDFFEGLRKDSDILKTGSLHTPHHYRLYKYFDEYTKPGVDSKIGAAFALREQWKSEHFYYPGEAFKRNRPGFRSVPKELLNKQTWYRWSENFTKYDEIRATQRPRAQNPDWPPPGYRMPKFETRRLYEFGLDEPVICGEVDRYQWFKSWETHNMRYGLLDCVLITLLVATLYYLMRFNSSVAAYLGWVGGVYYPGKYLIRPLGVPNDFSKELAWWQIPLDKFPCKLTVWYLNESRFGYINYIKRRDAQEKALREAETHS